MTVSDHDPASTDSVLDTDQPEVRTDQPEVRADEPEVRTPITPTPEVRADEPTVRAGEPAEGFLSPQPRRLRLESVFVRLVATAGVVGVGTALGAVLVTNEVAGWIVGLTVSVVSVLFARRPLALPPALRRQAPSGLS